MAAQAQAGQIYPALESLPPSIAQPLPATSMASLLTTNATASDAAASTPSLHSPRAADPIPVVELPQLPQLAAADDDEGPDPLTRSLTQRNKAVGTFVVDDRDMCLMVNIAGLSVEDQGRLRGLSAAALGGALGVSVGRVVLEEKCQTPIKLPRSASSASSGSSRMTRQELRGVQFTEEAVAQAAAAEKEKQEAVTRKHKEELAKVRRQTVMALDLQAQVENDLHSARRDLVAANRRVEALESELASAVAAHQEEVCRLQEDIAHTQQARAAGDTELRDIRTRLAHAVEEVERERAAASAAFAMLAKPTADAKMVAALQEEIRVERANQAAAVAAATQERDEALEMAASVSSQLKTSSDRMSAFTMAAAVASVVGVAWLLIKRN